MAGDTVELQSGWSEIKSPPREPLLELPALASSLIGARYLPSLDEWWKVSWEHTPGVKWNDQGTNFDDLTMDNFWNALSRSKDGGQTWSEKERMNVPFPSGRAYQPVPGKAGAV